MCIKRKQPCTALKQMPHYTTWGGTYLTENIGGQAGPGGTTYFTENVGSNSGPGGSTFLTGYSEAIGLDSSIFDVVNKLTGSADPGGDDV